MDIQDRNLWKQAAGERLAASFYDPRKLVAIHTGVAIGVSLVATLVSHLLDRLIAQTVGLGGLSTRVNLESIRMLVILLPGLLTIFWDAGYRSAMLRIGRGEAVMPRGLLEGFQSFWPLLRHALLRGLLGIPVGMLCWYAAEILFLLTPFSAPMLEALAPVMESGTLNQNLMLDPAVQEAMLQAAVPLLVLFGLLLAAGLVLVYFPMRMSVYALLEEPEKGALFAIRKSSYLLRNCKMHLFRLDLSFWWYYLLRLLLAVVCYLDVLLAALKVQTGLSPMGLSLCCYGLFLVGALALSIGCRNRVEETYVQFYKALGQPQPAAPAAPQKQPWGN